MRNNTSRYYGDKHARTMEAAFDEADAEPEEADPFVCMLLGAVFFAAFICIAAGIGVLAARG